MQVSRGPLAPPPPSIPGRTSSTMSPFSACTWARAPRSRMMLKISYIWGERPWGAASLRERPGDTCLSPPLGTGPYLAVSALAPVLVRHEDQEGVHTWREAGGLSHSTTGVGGSCLGAPRSLSPEALGQGDPSPRCPPSWCGGPGAPVPHTLPSRRRERTEPAQHPCPCTSCPGIRDRWPPRSKCT